MTSIQPKSRKIKKKTREELNNSKHLICGACFKAYTFYASLYLHIKQKHDGIKPLGTKIERPGRPTLQQFPKGRPKKNEKNIDHISETQEELETIQNDLMHFLAEKLFVLRKLGAKPPLDSIVTQIMTSCKSETDKWLRDVGGEAQTFLINNKDQDMKLKNPDFENDLVRLDPTKGLSVVVWFVIWLAKIFVKPEFIPDLCLVMSRVWKVIEEGQLEAQDLDNQLVWKKVIKDCEKLISQLPAFQAKSPLLNEFIRKICQIIGKAYERNL